MIPFTVIGGFLGAGKTTLLNRLLAGAAGRRFAVLVNDFGALDIDAGLVAAHGGDTVSLANGCVCCTIGDSLVESLLGLLEREERFDHIVVEASGVADPARIADLAVIEPRLQRDGVIVVVDAAEVLVRAADRRVGDTVLRQIRAADLLVLNKLDLVENLVETRSWLAAQSSAPRLEARYADIPIDLLFGLEHRGARGGGADDAFRSWSYEWPQPIERAVLMTMLQEAKDVLRAKGIVRFADKPDRRSIVHMVGRRIDVSEDGLWRDGASRLVLLAPKAMGPVGRLPQI